MAQLHQGLKEGNGLSQPLQQTGVFPPLAIHMITVGEETGTLGEMRTPMTVKLSVPSNNLYHSSNRL